MRYLLNSFLVLIISIALFQSDGENNSYISDIKKYQEEMNAEFKDSAFSPLTKEDIVSFKALDFYPIDSNYSVEVELVLNDSLEKFGMKTTTARLPIYIKYGIAHFKLQGRDFKINIYQNVALSKRDKYQDYLFMLFTDKTSGTTSYAGGRYIDLRIPKGDKLLIDFNKSYNPYCAYNHKYSCPIPPEEDHFDIEILAGVKAFH